MLSEIFRRLRFQILRRKIEREMDNEMRFHLELETEKNIRQGMSEEEARLAAQRSFGGVEQTKEAYRDAARFRRLEEVGQDLRYGARLLLKNRAFTLVAVLTVALGIGANSAIFSIAYAVLLSPLPYLQAERLVASEIMPGQNTNGRQFTAQEFLDLGNQNQFFEHSSTFGGKEIILTGRGEPERLKFLRVTQEFLPLFGLRPSPGRAFSLEEFQPGHDQVVLISHHLWQTRFSANPNLIGQSITLQQKSYTVIGITPQDFNFFLDADLLLPKAIGAEELRYPYCFCYPLIARLKPGITIEAARRGLPAGTRIYPLRELLVRDFRPTLFVLWGVVGIVLLISCANFANLLLARASDRRKEMAIRMAIGARRGRVVRQLLTESILLALIGGVVGLLFAHFGIYALLAAGPLNLPHPASEAHPIYLPQFNIVSINGWVIAFTFGVSLLTGMIFGLAPALRLSSPDLNDFLKEGAAVSKAGFRLWRRRLLQSSLVVAEIALSLVLLAGAGLLVRSFWRLHRITPGFKAEKLLTIQLEFPWYRFREHSQMLSFIDRMTEYLEGLPGVQSVGATSSLPLIGRENIGGFGVVDEEELTITPELYIRPPDIDFMPDPARDPKYPRLYTWAQTVNVSTSYFRTMRIPLIQGREFDKFDNEQSMQVAVINETAARRYWLGKDPIGKRLGAALGKRRPGLPTSRKPTVTIVGIVGDSMQNALEKQPLPTIYRPLLQSTRRKVDYKLAEALQAEVDYMGLAVRTSGRPEDLLNAAQKQARLLDPDQPALRVAAMEDILNKAVELPRFNMLLFGLLASIALLLAAIGIYGLMAYLVAQRTHEIGIRLALGAQKSDVLLLVMKHGMKLAAMGMAVGLGAASALTKLIRSWLFGVSATDPLTFGGIVVLLAGVALLACYLPARKATEVDPLVALRRE